MLEMLTKDRTDALIRNFGEDKIHSVPGACILDYVSILNLIEYIFHNLPICWH